jgi:hypothetical protein
VGIARIDRLITKSRTVVNDQVQLPGTSELAAKGRGRDAWLAVANCAQVRPWRSRSDARPRTDLTRQLANTVVLPTPGNPLRMASIPSLWGASHVRLPHGVHKHFLERCTCGGEKIHKLRRLLNIADTLVTVASWIENGAATLY